MKSNRYSMIKVSAVQDDSSHWYIIPSTMCEEFSNLTEEMGEFESYWDRDHEWKGTPNVWKVFEDKFSKYRTGGGLNNIQLYAEI